MSTLEEIMRERHDRRYMAALWPEALKCCGWDEGTDGPPPPYDDAMYTALLAAAAEMHIWPSGKEAPRLPKTRASDRTR